MQMIKFKQRLHDPPFTPFFHCIPSCQLHLCILSDLTAGRNGKPLNAHVQENYVSALTPCPEYHTQQQESKLAILKQRQVYRSSQLQ